jgi:hypothetical protein
MHPVNHCFIGWINSFIPESINVHLHHLRENKNKLANPIPNTNKKLSWMAAKPTTTRAQIFRITNYYHVLKQLINPNLFWQLSAVDLSSTHKANKLLLE